MHHQTRDKLQFSCPNHMLKCSFFNIVREIKLQVLFFLTLRFLDERTLEIRSSVGVSKVWSRIVQVGNQTRILLKDSLLTKVHWLLESQHLVKLQTIWNNIIQQNICTIFKSNQTNFTSTYNKRKVEKVKHWL
jgi:hypothetical protein